MSHRTITFGGVVYTCPFSRCFRRHTESEFAHLTESVRLRGVQNTVRVYEDTTLGLSNCVLDGEGRLSAAAAVGLTKVPLCDLGKVSQEDALALARDLNDVRRHDDPEVIRQRRVVRIERVAGARASGRSLRAIAEVEEISEAQVRRDLKASTAPVGSADGSGGGAVEVPEEVTGRDGKTRPARRKAKKTETEDESPLSALASESTKLTTHLTKLLSAGDEYAAKLRHAFTVCGLLDFPKEYGGNPRFLALSGVPALLELVGRPGDLPKDSVVLLTYSKANGSWVPPLTKLRRQRKSSRQRSPE